MNNSKIEIARKWFEELRDKLILSIEKIDSTNFIITEWDHKHKGGGKMSKIKGQVIEKGGVNISTVEGKFEENMINEMKLLHFHLGSQISDIGVIKDALQEASQIYVELCKLGAPMQYIDVGWENIIQFICCT